MINEPKQKRSEATLQRILQVVEHLIDAGGFEQATMQEIARDAGVSVGTLYKRFRAKQDIVDYLVEHLQTQQYDAFIQQLRECTTTSLSERIEHLNTCIEDSTSRYAGLLRTITIAHLLGRTTSDDEKRSRSASLINSTARWLHESEHGPDLTTCEKAVAMMFFAYQYGAIYPAPQQLFGAEAHAALIHEMTTKYLGVER